MSARWQNSATSPDPERPIKVTIRIGFTDPSPFGLPGSRDEEPLLVIEDVLLDELSAHNASLVMVVTGNNAREFIAYASSHDWLDEWGPTVLERWASGRPGTGVEAVSEPDWATFFDLETSARRTP